MEAGLSGCYRRVPVAESPGSSDGRRLSVGTGFQVPFQNSILQGNENGQGSPRGAMLGAWWICPEGFRGSQ
jgi:hypothetical protein